MKKKLLLTLFLFNILPDFLIFILIKNLVLFLQKDEVLSLSHLQKSVIIISAENVFNSKT